MAISFKARRNQSILFWTFTTSYINIVGNNIIANWYINSDSIKRADIIWGPAESVIQGKMGKKKTQQNSKTDTASIRIKTT